MKSQFRDLTNQTFSRLTVIEQSGPLYRCRQRSWLCKCECGKTKIIAEPSLKKGLTKSCGCLAKEHGHNMTKHGRTRTSEWFSWQSMKARCLNPNHIKFKNWGGRGIKVCDRWINSFENFFKDMGPRPSLKYSIDRFPDNDGNYEPSNCRWATMKQQNNNTRRNKNKAAVF